MILDQERREDGGGEERGNNVIMGYQRRGEGWRGESREKMVEMKATMNVFPFCLRHSTFSSLKFSPCIPYSFRNFLCLLSTLFP